MVLIRRSVGVSPRMCIGVCLFRAFNIQTHVTCGSTCTLPHSNSIGKQKKRKKQNTDQADVACGLHMSRHRSPRPEGALSVRQMSYERLLVRCCGVQDRYNSLDRWTPK